MPPLRGVIHAPWIPMYDVFENISYEGYMSAVKPKVDGAWNLHQHTLEQPIDFFVMMSSVHGIFGNRGQSSTAAAHTFLDAFMQYRLAQGLPAITVDLPIIRDIGYMAENSETNDMVADVVFEALGQAEFLSFMEMAIRGRRMARNSRTSHAHHIITGMGVSPKRSLPFWTKDTRFTHLNRAGRAPETQSTPTTETNQGITYIRDTMQKIRCFDKSIQLICNALMHKISVLEMIPMDELNASSPLTDYGLDSISAIELRNWVMRDMGATLGLQDILSSPSITDFATLIAHRSKYLVRLARSG